MRCLKTREKADFEECLEYFKDDPYVEVFLWKDSYNCIKIVVKGKEKTVYENGTFIFELRSPIDYPFRPPYAFCHTRIWHPNINNEIPSDRPNIYLYLINPVLTGTVGGWTPSKTFTVIDEMLKKLIHLEAPIFNIETIVDTDLFIKLLIDTTEESLGRDKMVEITIFIEKVDGLIRRLEHLENIFDAKTFV